MAETFNAQQFDINTINGGYKYKDGDGVSADTINKVVEASAYAQQIEKERKLYEHYIKGEYLSSSGYCDFNMSFISRNPTPIQTANDIKSYMVDNGYKYPETKAVNGFIANQVANITGLYIGGNGIVNIRGVSFAGSFVIYLLSDNEERLKINADEVKEL